MNIAIQAADLDASRIDGTRVYIKKLLERFGDIGHQDDFHIYHRDTFNTELEPPKKKNYYVHQVKFPCMWTQTRFAYEIWKTTPDRLWMPMQALPIVRSSRTKTIVTIHDLAFKTFPHHFPNSDRRKLEMLSGYAINKSDEIIAISENTKKDILQYYPKIDQKKIQVINHGFDKDLFRSHVNAVDSQKILERYAICSKRYILYVGAIQPRKNLIVLINAFERLKKNSEYKELKLVLAGEEAWLWEDVKKAVQNSIYKKDIIITGTLSFEHIKIIYKEASVFVFPSLYEGFGLPILEAFASRIPVICADNSSLPEVGGQAALYFSADQTDELVDLLNTVLSKEVLRKELIHKGEEQLKKFSWDKCAQETLDRICS